MMRIRMLALPVAAALAFPLIADAGIGLRGRIGSRSGEVVSSAPVGAATSSTPAATGGAAPAPAPAPIPTTSPPGKIPLTPVPQGCAPGAPAAAPAAPAADGSCGGHGSGHGLFGGLFANLCGGGHGGLDGHHGALGNHPPEFGPGFRGFGFCQPPFQAAPWYLYWPYDAHFQLPAPISAPYFAPQQYAAQWNPYFPAPAMGPAPGMPGMGPVPAAGMGPGGPPPHFGPAPR